MNNAEYFEQSMARIEEIVGRLEGGSLTLGESIALYKEGAELTEKCRKALTEARLAVSAVGDEKSE
ncbi:MAG: exodeoxyribonuclease VII small subunit [Ruminococcus sp.]|nr:exodeoxyribonuclease VII small subunit [Ruminococcus sp.]